MAERLPPLKASTAASALVVSPSAVAVISGSRAYQRRMTTCGEARGERARRRRQSKEATQKMMMMTKTKKKKKKKKPQRALASWRIGGGLLGGALAGTRG